MAQATRSKNKESKLASQISHGVRESALFLFGALGIYVLISLIAYQPTDPGLSYSSSNNEVQNIGGIVGAYVADIFYTLFGFLAYLFPLMIAFAGWFFYKGESREDKADVKHILFSVMGFLLSLIAGTGLASLLFIIPDNYFPMGLGPGGVLGDITSKLFLKPFSNFGATLFLFALFLTGISLATGLSWLKVIDAVGSFTLQLISLMRENLMRCGDFIKGKRAKMERVTAVKLDKKKTKLKKPPRIEPVIKSLQSSERVEREKQFIMFKNVPENGELPPLSLLDVPKPSQNEISTASLEAMSKLVEMKLQDFGIDVNVVAVNPGPIITRYELQPAPGIKVSRISNLAKDLARALSAISVRIVEVIPGKSVIGLEIPNEFREVVRLSEILHSEQYDDLKTPVPIALGKDIAGLPVVVDLIKMPHLLIAGTTGSGKSVAVNAMILSMLYSSTPKDLRLIMIDPKMLELSIYEGIPHLLAPVVTDMKEASHALRWCVAEMDRRYALMAALGVRNIANFNKKVSAAIEKGEPIKDPIYKVISDEDHPTLTTLPVIVVVIDELADMMMIVGKKVEELIARLAQKARASGIHLILATQRPSVDVITGLIKANIPTRIAFQVSSKIDSRTILDQMGAEQLLGHGDMLYLPAGTGVPLRVHGALVEDHEVHKVVSKLKADSKGPEYIEEILQPSNIEGIDKSGQYDVSDSEVDVLYDQALKIVTETRKASISGVQRRLKIGYNRAARMVEEMERSGVVGPLQSNGGREVIAPPPPAD